mgnify:CR=1 FL=1
MASNRLLFRLAFEIEVCLIGPVRRHLQGQNRRVVILGRYTFGGRINDFPAAIGRRNIGTNPNVVRGDHGAGLAIERGQFVSAVCIRLGVRARPCIRAVALAARLEADACLGQRLAIQRYPAGNWCDGIMLPTTAGDTEESEGKSEEGRCFPQAPR